MTPAGLTRRDGAPGRRTSRPASPTPTCRSSSERLAAPDRGTRLGVTTYVGNDTFALLRAGLETPAGRSRSSAAPASTARSAAGRPTARFAAVGKISGDWGGGAFLAEEAMWWAARAADGRGATTLAGGCCPPTSGRGHGRADRGPPPRRDLRRARAHELDPDAVRGGRPRVTRWRPTVVQRQAEEIVALAVVGAATARPARRARRRHAGRRCPDRRPRAAAGRDRRGSGRAAPKALARVVSAPPVVGAALLGLDRIGASADAQARLRSSVT